MSTGGSGGTELVAQEFGPTARDDDGEHDSEPAIAISARFELERMRQRMNTGEPCSVLVGRDGRFALIRILGQGGMGDVYLARDAVLERDVALKVIAARHRHSSSLRHRLLREAQALAAVRHPNVLEVYDVDTSASDELFLTMSHVRGRTLRSWQGDRPLRDVIAAYISAGRGLAAAHAEAIVHGDFKPGNVMLDEQSGQVLVADFGLARAVTQGGPLVEATGATAGDGSQPLPSGTPSYMAPELFAGQPSSYVSDQYAYCVAVWEAIAGVLPFPDSRQPGAPIPPRPPRMPAWLYRVLRRGLSERPEERFAEMTGVLSALARGLRRRRLAATAALATTMSAAMMVLARASAEGGEDCSDMVADIDAVWNANARQRVEQALTGVVPGDVRVAHYAREVLDASAERWRRASVARCEEHRLAPLDHRVVRERSCYQRWPAQFGRRVELLVRGGPEAARHIHEILEPLLWAGEGCRLPRPSLQDGVQTALEAAEEAELLHAYDRAQKLAEEALALSADVGPPCVAGQTYSLERGEALYRLGHIHNARESPGEAVAAFDGAALQALGCGHDELLARVGIQRAQVLALHFEQPEAAEQAVSQAAALFDRLGASGVQASELDKARGFVALVSGRPLAAVEWYEAAIAALGDGVGVQTSKAMLFADIGAALQEHGDEVSAERALRRSVELVSTALGPDHPETKARDAQATFNLALMSLERGAFAHAREQLHAVSQLGEPALAIKGQLALVLALAQEAARSPAAVDGARALAVAVERADYLPPRTRAEALTIAGQVLADVDDPSGLALLGRALELWDSVPDSAFNRNVCELDYARALAAAGRHAEAKRRIDGLAARLGEDADPRVSDGVRELGARLSGRGELTDE